MRVCMYVCVYIPNGTRKQRDLLFKIKYQHYARQKAFTFCISDALNRAACCDFIRCLQLSLRRPNPLLTCGSYLIAIFVFLLHPVPVTCSQCSDFLMSFQENNKGWFILRVLNRDDTL
jgi:hypothetical protein